MDLALQDRMFIGSSNPYRQFRRSKDVLETISKS